MKKLFCILLGILVVTGLIVLLFNLDLAVEFTNNFIQNENIIEEEEPEEDETLEAEEELEEESELEEEPAEEVKEEINEVE